MKPVWASALALLISTSPVCAEVVGEAVNYQAGDVTLKGYLAYDNAIKTKQPAVLVVHEWWGHNEYARKRATMLAELGYTALAVDMYGDGKTATHPKEAGAFAGEVSKNMPVAKARFEAALDLLKKRDTVDSDKLAAIGYCFGGGVVLNMARLGVDLAGVASFHGALATENPAQPGTVKAKVIVFNGADDPMSPPAQVETLKKEMQDAGVAFEYVGYPGVKHSFTNPDADKIGAEFSLPLTYNAAADKDSWNKLTVFLKDIFADKK